MSVPPEARPVRIALVDDDSGLVTMLEHRFEGLRWEHEVLAYPPGHDQLAAMRLHAIVLNPALSGLDYIERVSGALPGLAMLAICRPVQVADRVRALRTGADDWITKPCHPEELIARIQAVNAAAGSARRCSRMRPRSPVSSRSVPISSMRSSTTNPPGYPVRSTSCCISSPRPRGGSLEREVIYQRVWGYAMVRGDRSVDVFVRKLRNKLEQISPGWRYVHTHFGVGYRFAAERDDHAGGGGNEPGGGGERDSNHPGDPRVGLGLTASR